MTDLEDQGVAFTLGGCRRKRIVATFFKKSGDGMNCKTLFVLSALIISICGDQCLIQIFLGQAC